LIEIGSKTAEKNSAQTNKQADRQTNRHYENNGHMAVNQYYTVIVVLQGQCMFLWSHGRAEGWEKPVLLLFA